MDRLTFAAVGDVMLGDHPVCFGHGIRSAIRKKGYEYIVAEVRDELQGHDAVFGNLECVLSDIGHDETRLKSSELRADKAAVELLRSCNFNLLSVANNHMLQHGIDAFADNAAWLRSHGMQPVGLYEDGHSNVAKIDKGEVGLAVIGFSLRPEYYCKDNRHYASGGPEVILRQVEQMHAQEPKRFIVVSLHWGEEYLHTPSKEQIELAHRLIDAGATLIVGHHPHVLQGVERYGSGLIAYSLGNFIFDSWQKPTRESAILSCTFTRDGLQEFRMTPVAIRRNYALTSKDAEENAQIRRKLEQYSDEIVQRKGLADQQEPAYQEVAASAYYQYRMQCYRYFLLHLWKYNPKIIFSSLFRAVLRRVGLA